MRHEIWPKIVSVGCGDASIDRFCVGVGALVELTFIKNSM